jgi:hypothetical protein
MDSYRDVSHLTMELSLDKYILNKKYWQVKNSFNTPNLAEQ